MNMNNKKIALYGLGTETERLLKKWDGKHNVIGLLDGFVTSGEQFGYPIIDISEVVKQDNVIIVVVARPGSCKAIARRIGDLCKKNNVPLVDNRGNDLLADKRVVYDFKSIKGYTKNELLEQIKKADIISFDLFDTLIVRNIASSSDVIELLDVKLQEKGIHIPDFVNKRIGAEKMLSKDSAPRLEAIYKRVVADLSDSNITAEALAEMEFQTDVSLLRPREEIVNFIQYIKQKKKQVYITSESYYSKSQIEQILSMNGILGIDEVFVSCEYNMCKTSGLFAKVSDYAKTKNILHIGDDIVADVEAAKRDGLKAFHIYSSYELLDRVGGLNVTTYNNDLSDKIRVGMFASKIFNSPFQFEDSARKIHVDDVANLGYLFCAPMIFDFAYWFGKMVKEHGLSNLLFCARDGYLIKKIFSVIYPEIHSHYFLTSRIAAIRAGVFDEEDIAYVDSMKFSGNVEDNLNIRFGINITEIENKDINWREDGLKKYSKVIQEAAELKKKNYEKYIQTLGLDSGSIALFDFVAKGTSQMYIQRLISNEIQGLYFLQLEPEFMENKGIEIHPFYTEEERAGSAIFDNYYILETMLTSPDPSVDEFDEDGNPIFASETRSDKDIKCFIRAQDGMLEYVEKYLKICPRSAIKINKKLDEEFLTLIHDVEIRDKDFLELKVEDPFFNRMTDITNIL